MEFSAARSLLCGTDWKSSYGVVLVASYSFESIFAVLKGSAREKYSENLSSPQCAGGNAEATARC